MAMPALQYLDSEDDIAALAEIAAMAKDLTGVQLTERHYSMIRSRLQSRLVRLGLDGLSSYPEYLRSHPEEQTFLISSMTTHHTYFFREMKHFELLTQKVVPWLIARAGSGPKKLRVWSAACSRGQEVYSLAMWLAPLLETYAPGMQLEILGTDVDPESVELARNGVYPWKEVKEIPLQFLGANWSRGKGEISEYAKAKSSLKSFCHFETGNLLTGRLPQGPFDLIFCRNVFIYFSPDQIKLATQRLLGSMAADGFLFVGISESLQGLNLALKSAGPSLYVREGHPILLPAAVARPKSVAVPAPSPDSDVRVLIVEDSVSIQTLLRKVFDKAHGFEVVGVANDGLEAAELRRKLNPDIMTLDIHMPRQNGVEYLKSNYGPGHPPVVMISSVSREDQALALQALESGASDYVEKPSLSQLSTVAEEMRNKVSLAAKLGAVRSKAASRATQMSMDRAFKKASTITQPERKARVLAFQPASRAQVIGMIPELTGPGQPPLILVLDSAGTPADLVSEQVRKSDTRMKSEAELRSGDVKQEDRYLISNTGTAEETLKRALEGRQAVVMVAGEVSDKLAGMLAALDRKGVSYLLEDLGSRNSKQRLASRAKDVSPLSGFAYLSSVFLGGDK